MVLHFWAQLLGAAVIRVLFASHTQHTVVPAAHVQIAWTPFEYGNTVLSHVVAKAAQLKPAQGSHFAHVCCLVKPTPVSAHDQQQKPWQNTDENKAEAQNIGMLCKAHM